ncbi:MAG: alpha/beta hydrolase [Eubacteriaceae bacterium]|nr:alpha/beta hydrolase [Eubacteriaceae bacterium]
MIILLVLLLLLLAVSYICYRMVFFVPKQNTEDVISVPDTEQYALYKNECVKMIKNVLDIPYEEVWIQADDGIRLFGKYYETSPGAPLQIMFHGYRSAGERDFCGGLPCAIERGYNVLMVDQRAHGKSGGKCLTFGIKERYDCLTWINYAVERFGTETEIFLYGLSMGAATVLMATELELPSNVKAVVADCGYSSPADIVKKVMKDRHYPVWLLYPVVRLGGIVFGGFDMESAGASGAMINCRIPVLFIHGEDDRFVPCDMSRENFRLCASEKKRILTVPGAAHGISYMVDKITYLKELDSFLESISQ